VSNNAQLLISKLSGQPETDEDLDAEAMEEYINIPILESEYTVPIFWLTLFGPENIKTYIDPDDEIDIPYLVDSVANAKDRFKQRLPELRKVFKNIDLYVPYWQKWLDDIDREFIKVQLFEILEMSDDGYDLLEPALKFLEDPKQETMLAFMRLTDFPYIIDQDTHTIVDRELENGKNTQEFLIGYDPWQ
jgi:hypothetical protein